MLSSDQQLEPWVISIEIKKIYPLSNHSMKSKAEKDLEQVIMVTGQDGAQVGTAGMRRHGVLAGGDRGD